MRRLLIVPCVVLLLCPLAAAEEETIQEAWSAVFVEGKKSGWSHHRVVEIRDGEERRFRSENEMELVLSRLGQELRILQGSITTEDEAGTVLSFTHRVNMGMGDMVTEGRLKDGAFVVRVNGVEQTIPYPEGALGPWAVDRQFRAQGIRPGMVHEARVFNPERASRAIHVAVAVGEKESVDLLGRVRELHRVEATMDIAPNPQILWMDDEGTPFGTEWNIAPVGTIRTVVTEESIAKAESEPAEVFLSSLLVPDRAIENPRSLRRAVYRLRNAEGGAPDVFEGEGQRVLETLGDAVVLEVEIPAPDASTPSWQPPFPTEGWEPYLAANAYLECDDEVLRELAREAAGEPCDAVMLAGRIERFVRELIDEKNLNVGFATAAEVARSRQGDCTEHGVLAAALARILGLPSRVVVGLVYIGTSGSEAIEAEGVFGFHMWAEVRVADDAWMAIDAAIGGMDATHIALAKSDLASVSPLYDLGLPVMRLMGQLRIEVVEVGAAEEVPAGR
ncbi:MAG: transglutaminase-like domain-containing protein [Planctomycetota bacterium]|jgi:transglutaminase-like putative cysteine protease